MVRRRTTDEWNKKKNKENGKIFRNALKSGGVHEQVMKAD